MGLAEFFTVKEPEEEEPAPFDWKWMCAPRMPWAKPQQPPPFYKLHQKVSWPVAFVMGFQHSLVMTSGIVITPLLMAGPARLSVAEREYLIAASLIASGLFSFIQIKQFRFGDSGYYLGTGLISLLGTALQFVPIGQMALEFMMKEDSTMPCESDADCINAWSDSVGEVMPGVSNVGQCNLDSGMCKRSGQEAYGAYLGTLMVGALVQVFMSFVPRKNLKRIFPPLVTGVCVMLIGIGVTGIGIRQWGGGDFCGKQSHKRFKTTTGRDIKGNFAGDLYPSLSPCASGHCAVPHGALAGVCKYTPAKFDAAANITKGDVTICESFKDLPGIAPANTDPGTSAVMCTDNGEVVLPFGSPEYVGLGFAVFGFLVFLEMFGSPFLRNCGVMVALFFGLIVASVVKYTPPGSDQSLNYVTDDRLRKAPAVTFLWAHTFPLGFYAPALLPVLISYVVAAVDTIGDIAFSAEASGVPIEGEEFDGRVQGGLLADGLASLLAPLTTTMPNTTISMNNSVISLTRCANKRAGYCCSLWLILFGALAKISAIIISIPICVMGGMTTFVFVNITCSVMKTLGDLVENRRNRFIVAASLGLGIGVAIVPDWINNALIPRDGNASEMVALFRDSAAIILSTPYALGTIVAMLLHAIIPEDKEEGDAASDEASSAPSVPAQLMFPASGGMVPPEGRFHTVQTVFAADKDKDDADAEEGSHLSTGIVVPERRTGSVSATPTASSFRRRVDSSAAETPRGFRKV